MAYLMGELLGLGAWEGPARCQEIHAELKTQAALCLEAGGQEKVPDNPHCVMARKYLAKQKACVEMTPLEQAAQEVRQMPTWKWVVAGLVLAGGIYAAVKLGEKV